MTAEAIVKELVKTADLFGIELSESRITAYLEALDDIEADAVVGAFRALRKTAKFFPRPAEIRDAVIGSPEILAEEAWSCARSYEQGDKMPDLVEGTPLERNETAKRAMLQAVDTVGGWRLLTGDAPVRHVSFMHKDFLGAFLRDYQRAIMEQHTERVLGPAPKALPAAQKALTS